MPQGSLNRIEVFDNPDPGYAGWNAHTASFEITTGTLEAIAAKKPYPIETLAVTLGHEAFHVYQDTAPEWAGFSERDRNLGAYLYELSFGEGLGLHQVVVDESWAILPEFLGRPSWRYRQPLSNKSDGCFEKVCTVA